MPHTVKRLRKKISITNNMLSILNAYQEAISDLSEEQKNVLGLSTEERPREVFGSSFLKFAESMTNYKVGATECYLGAIECSLSEFAYQLRENYLICLNRLVEVTGKTAKDAEQEVIESRYILIRELLLRLVTVALSEEENAKRSGSGLIGALNEFVKAITKDVAEALNLNMSFRYDLNQQLADWVGDFNSAVETIELIHAPENALTRTINYLSSIKKAIKAYILVQCTDIASQGYLSDDWIETTYQKFLYGQENAIVVRTFPALAFSEAQLIKLDGMPSGRKKDRIGSLWMLLNHTEMLYGMITRLDEIIKASGWVLLLTGKLSFDELIAHLKAHQGLCNEQLDFEKTGLRKDSPASRILLTQGCISGKNITQVVPEICDQIRCLGHHQHHRLIVEQFAENVRDLMIYQDHLGIDLICDVSINPGQLETNQYSSIEQPVSPTLLLDASFQAYGMPIPTHDNSSQFIPEHHVIIREISEVPQPLVTRQNIPFKEEIQEITLPLPVSEEVPEQLTVNPIRSQKKEKKNMLEEIPETEIKMPNEQKSVVDPEFSFNQDHWVVSVLNTKEKLFGGHAVLLVEGIKEGQLFVGRYDVLANIHKSSLTHRSSIFAHINEQGHISDVRVIEGASYDHQMIDLALISAKKEVTPSDVPHNTLLLQKVENQVTAYWLQGSWLHKKTSSIEQLVEIKDFEFPAIGEPRSVVEVNIPLLQKITALYGYPLLGGRTFYGQCSSRSFKRPFEEVAKMIESIKADQRLTEEAHHGRGQPLRYQLVGSQNAHGLLTLFSESGGGINCAEWCLQKLEVAGVDLEEKPTPNRVAGGACPIL